MVGKKKAKGEGFEQGVNSFKKKKMYIFFQIDLPICAGRVSGSVFKKYL